MSYTSPSYKKIPEIPVPTSDSFGARTRVMSHFDFKTSTSGVATKAMKNEISALVSSVQDSQTRKAFDTEMQSFFYLFARYLAERAQSKDL
jgi:UTP--glucose-1-phosphate uridylyltransferase